MACAISVPRPGIKPVPLQWKHGVPTTGPPGKSQVYAYFTDGEIPAGLGWNPGCMWPFLRPTCGPAAWGYYSQLENLMWPSLAHGVPCPSLATSSPSLLPHQTLLSSQAPGLLLEALHSALLCLPSFPSGLCPPDPSLPIPQASSLWSPGPWASPCHSPGPPPSPHSILHTLQSFLPRLWNFCGNCQLTTVQPMVPQSSTPGQSRS